MSRPYESPKRTEQAAETRRKILRALVALLTEELAATVSIPQVAKRAGVSVRIVYHHFPSKEALFDGLFDHLQELVVRPHGEDPPPATTFQALADQLPAAYRYLHANRDLFRALRFTELAPRLQAQRSAARAERVDVALADLLPRLPAAEARRVRSICGLLASFEGYEALTTTWGLSVDEAGEAAAQTIRSTCAAATTSEG
jgi:AcrR family transcriptional regulator